MEDILQSFETSSNALNAFLVMIKAIDYPALSSESSISIITIKALGHHTQKASGYRSQDS